MKNLFIYSRQIIVGHNCVTLFPNARRYFAIIQGDDTSTPRDVSRITGGLRAETCSASLRPRTERMVRFTLAFSYLAFCHMNKLVSDK